MVRLETHKNGGGGNASQHGSRSCSAAYRGKAPIDGCVYQKQLDLCLPVASILSKRDLSTITIGYFCDIIPLLTRNKNGILPSMRKKI
jgi:hypothetical protein